MARTRATGVIVACTVSVVFAQQPKPGFEVASVKPQPPAASFGTPAAREPRVRPGGVFSGTHATVASLIRFAWDLKAFQISGGPEWVGHGYFEIDARAEEADASIEEIRLMVQSLLEERFALVTHLEQREMRVHALIRARPNGSPGPKLLRIDECSPAFVSELRRKFPEKYPAPMGTGVTSGCVRRRVSRS